MISLKAISTSRRKPKAILIALMMLLPVMLAAAPFRVSVLSDDASYASILSDALALIQGEVTAPGAVEAFNARAAAEAEMAAETELSSLRVREDFSGIEALSTEEGQEDGGPPMLELVRPDFSATEEDYLLHGDSDAFQYLMRREDLDMLIAADISYDGQLSECTLYINGEEAYRSLFVSSSEDDEFAAVISLLSERLKGPDHIPVHVSLPSSATLYADGEAVPFIRSMAVLPAGEHEMLITVPGYEDLALSLDIAEGTAIAPELERKAGGRMYLSVTPYDSDIYFQGLLTSSRTIGDVQLPFQVTAVHEGFSPLTVQSRMAMDRMVLSLRPEWMTQYDTVGRAKDRFYTDLLTTLVSFGCYVASSALSGIYTDVYIAPAVTLFAGVSFVQLVELFDSMFDYYQAARMGI